MKRILFWIFMCAPFCLGTQAFAQHWSEILPTQGYSKTFPYQAKTPFFLNDNIGFVYWPFSLDDGTNSGWNPNLNRTIDGGQTWTYLPFFDSIHASIAEMSFVSLNHGYAATWDPNSPNSNASGGIYETLDQGVHWSRITDSGMFISVYSTGSKIFAIEKPQGDWQPNYTAGSLLLLKESGSNHWDTVVSMPDYKFRTFGNAFTYGLRQVTGNRDSLVIAVFFDIHHSSYLLYSTNLGKDWSKQQLDTNLQSITDRIVSIPHSCNVIREISSTTIDGNTVLHSSLDFAKWDTTLSSEIGGYVAGNSCAQYLCNAGIQLNNAVGVFRSIDRGLSWNLMTSAGPRFEEIDDDGFRALSIVGYGAVVYACDANDYSLWKTTDGGDGTLNVASLKPRLSFDHELSSGGRDTLYAQCEDGLITIIDENLSCAITSFQNITIDSLQPSEYTVTRTHHSSCQSLPDTTLIAIHPAQTGIRNVTIHSHYIDDEYVGTDTSFKIILNAIVTNGRPISTSVYVKQSSLTTAAGDTIEIPIFINSTQSPTQTGAAILELTYTVNTKLLTPFIFVPSQRGIAADPINISDTFMTVMLHFDPNFTFTDETEIGKLRCVAYVTDTLETNIAIASANSFSECLKALTDNSSIHFTLTGCGDSTLMKFMRIGKFPDFTIQPNPATSNMRVDLINKKVGEYNYELLDILGNSRKKGVTSDSSIQLDVSELSAGNYYLKICGAPRISATHGVLIIK